MNRRSSILNPVARILSAAALFAWMAAFVLCTAHCSFGVSHSQKSTCCKSESSTQKKSGENKSSNLACLTFKSALTPDNSPTLFGLGSNFFFQLPEFLMAPQTAFAEPVSLNFRQTRWFELLFTPEVSLGVAELHLRLGGLTYPGPAEFSRLFFQFSDE